MGVFYEELSKHEKKYIDNLISLQAYLNHKADIKYMCYYLKIDEPEFWERFLWKGIVLL